MAVIISIESFAGTCLKKHPPTSYCMLIHMLK